MKTFQNKKVVIISGVIVVLLVLCGVGFYFFQKNNDSDIDNSLKYKFTESSIELNGTLELEYSKEAIQMSDYIEVENGEVSVEPASINLEKLGDTAVIFTVKSDDGKSQEDIDCVVTVKDTQAPVITFEAEEVEAETLDGFDVVSNIQSVKDPVDGDLQKVDEEPSKLESSDDGKVYESGWYTVEVIDNKVKVKACDNHGNVTESEYTINVTKTDNTPDPNQDITTLWYLSSVELSEDGDWVQLSSHYDWYYRACTYLSSKYSTLDAAYQDVISHEASIGNTGDIGDYVRIFKEVDESGNVKFYQAGIEE